MTEFTKSVSQVPYLKVGKGQQEDTMPTIRVSEGAKITGTITGRYSNDNGELMYLKDVKIDGQIISGEVSEKVKIPVSVDLKNKLTFAKKEKDDAITIEYLGLHQSPTNAKRKLHKFNVS